MTTATTTGLRCWAEIEKLEDEPGLVFPWTLEWFWCPDPASTVRRYSSVKNYLTKRQAVETALYGCGTHTSQPWVPQRVFERKDGKLEKVRVRDEYDVRLRST